MYRSLRDFSQESRKKAQQEITLGKEEPAFSREEMDDQMVERGTGTNKFGHVMVLDQND